MYSRRTLTCSAVALLAMGFGLPTAAVAQTAKDLVGTWTNVSNINISSNGTRTDAFGPHGTGIAIFESNGHYTIINLNPDVPKFGANNRLQGTPAENKTAVGGAIAHYGTYSYDAAKKVINLKVEGSSYPNWTGTEQTRTIISFAGDDLKWSVAASAGGTGEVGWKRVK
jgi:Lipocalin-like domain